MTPSQLTSVTSDTRSYASEFLLAFLMAPADEGFEALGVLSRADNEPADVYSLYEETCDELLDHAKRIKNPKPWLHKLCRHIEMCSISGHYLHRSKESRYGGPSMFLTLRELNQPGEEPVSQDFSCIIGSLSGLVIAFFNDSSTSRLRKTNEDSLYFDLLQKACMQMLMLGASNKEVRDKLRSHLSLDAKRGSEFVTFCSQLHLRSI